MKELMNEEREMYETYWAFETGKWTKINSIKLFLIFIIIINATTIGVAIC